MIMINKKGTFKKSKFNDIITNSTGTNLIKGVDFTVIAPYSIDCTKVNSNVISVNSATHTIAQGDDVYITGSDGIKRQTFVKNVGTSTIELEDVIKPSNSTAITLEVDFYSITMNLDNDTDELYYFSDNEILIVSEHYLNIYVSYASLHSFWNGIDRNVDMFKLNEEALKFVLGSFSSTLDFYKKLDSNQIRNAIILQMLVMVTDDLALRQDNVTNYNNFINEMYALIERDNTGDVTPNPTDDSISNEFGTIDYGVRPSNEIVYDKDYL